MTVPKAVINDIAQNLLCGMNCYLHKETGELISILDGVEDWGYEDVWAEAIEKVEEDFDKYIVIRKPESYESFRVMEDFIETVEDEKLKWRLTYALGHRKPFAHFKDIVDNAGDYRQRWFDFRDQRAVEWVKDYLRTFPEDEEDASSL